jgi:SAM-dependent methyltransferase
MMDEVVQECRRILKPKGSAIFIMQPNAEKMGQMRLWLWRFIVSAGEEWNLVEDVYWWNPTAIPSRGAKREFGLMRPSVKMCVWLGPPNCYRNQDNVLWTPSEALAAKRRQTQARIVAPSGASCRNSTLTAAADERNGTTPFNLIPISASGQPGNGGHPAVTPYELAAWWCKYILPPGGVLLDPFCGSATMLLAGLDYGAGKVIGIDREKKYLGIAKKRIRTS